MSAVGVSAGLLRGSDGYIAGLSSRAGADVRDWSTADIPPQQGRWVLLTGGNGYPESGRSGL
ncbi:hypothetical protein GCM10007301_50420 [Azorhizobium oxalatiphilum]|uniref:Uncharacterized protein n=1 Tax=Azorhizobium oxalatiphilum TaxID=980631 RepID=A0A917CDB0_9HYPH|nr:hypothetical protein GCM10007301_50420 [Azorhizobium oxalatiphilum]